MTRSSTRLKGVDRAVRRQMWMEVPDDWVSNGSSFLAVLADLVLHPLGQVEVAMNTPVPGNWKCDPARQVHSGRKSRQRPLGPWTEVGSGIHHQWRV